MAGKKRILNDFQLSDTALRMGMLARAGLGYKNIASSGLEGFNHDLQEKAVRALNDGKQLDEALSETGMFPDYFIDMMGVGIETGRLEECLFSLHSYYLRMGRLKQLARDAAIQPLSMLGVTICVIAIIIIRIFPVFIGAYQSAGMAVPATVSVLSGFGQRVMANWIMALCVIITAIIAVAAGLKFGGMDVISKNLSRNTKTGKAMRGAKLAQALSMGLDAGMDVQDALGMACHVSEYPGGEPVKSAASGVPLGKVLMDARIITKAQADILASGTDAGALPDSMAYIAGSLMDDAESKIRKLSGKIEPCVTLTGTILAAGTVAMAMLPLLEAISSIG